MSVRLRWRDPTCNKSHYGPIRFGPDGLSLKTYSGEVSDYAPKVGPAQRRRRDRLIGLYMFQSQFRNHVEIIEAPPPASPPPAAETKPVEAETPKAEPTPSEPKPKDKPPEADPFYPPTTKGKAYAQTRRFVREAKNG